MHGVVIIYTPQGVATAVDLAKAISKTAKKSTKPILTAMMGSKEVEKARQVFYDNKVPTYEFPEEAIKTYMYMYHYARNLENLYETPEDVPLIWAPRRIISSSLFVMRRVQVNWF